MQLDMSVSVKGAGFGPLSAKAETMLGLAVRKAAHDVMASAKTAIQTGPKTGRTYKRNKRGKLHQASGPGEAPATDTGQLVNSITTKSVTRFASEVRVHSEYGMHLEYGTTSMDARPFMGPAVNTVRPSFEAACKQAVKM